MPRTDKLLLEGLLDRLFFVEKGVLQFESTLAADPGLEQRLTATSRETVTQLDWGDALHGLSCKILCRMREPRHVFVEPNGEMPGTSDSTSRASDVLESGVFHEHWSYEV